MPTTRGMSSCDACGPGRWMYDNLSGQENADNCVACIAGRASGSSVLTYPTSQTTDFCSICGENYYASGTGNSFCRTCGGGQWMSSEYVAEGLTTNAYCNSCPVGYNQHRGYTTVWTHPENDYLNACSECVPGRFADSEGTRYCTYCPTGKFMDVDSTSYTHENGYKSTSEDDCITCGYGFTSREGYSGEANSETCYCDAGYYYDNGACVDCPAGRFKDTDDYLRPSQRSTIADCVNCPTGRWAYPDVTAIGPRDSGCHNCSAGRYNDQEAYLYSYSSTDTIPTSAEEACVLCPLKDNEGLNEDGTRSQTYEGLGRSIGDCVIPTGQPSMQPSGRPSGQPSSRPSAIPSGQPSAEPSGQPSTQPTSPSAEPSSQPSGRPSGQPSGQPSGMPSGQPSAQPSARPSSQPSGQPSSEPSSKPSSEPSAQPSGQPSGSLQGSLRGCQAVSKAPSRVQDQAASLVDSPVVNPVVNLLVSHQLNHQDSLQGSLQGSLRGCQAVSQAPSRVQDQAASLVDSPVVNPVVNLLVSHQLNHQDSLQDSLQGSLQGCQAPNPAPILVGSRVRSPHHIQAPSLVPNQAAYPHLNLLRAHLVSRAVSRVVGPLRNPPHSLPWFQAVSLLVNLQESHPHNQAQSLLGNQPLSRRYQHLGQLGSQVDGQLHSQLEFLQNYRQKL